MLNEKGGEVLNLPPFLYLNNVEMFPLVCYNETIKDICDMTFV